MPAFREYVDTRGKVMLEGLVPLKALINTFAISSAECERAFNQMNLICTDVRNRLDVTNIASFLFINVNGPQLLFFNAPCYAKVWLSTHHSADYTKGKRRAEAVKNEDVHKLFHQWL